jgi:ADP-ribosylglycohydrolase
MKSVSQIERAQISLEGLTVGDAFGETYFIGFGAFEDTNASVEELIEKRVLAIGEWRWTDDSLMAFSVFENLQKYGEINQDALAQSFAEHYDVGRGFGSGMHTLLRQLREGANWREAATNLFEGQGSFGNGSAMRVAPLGAYFADDLKKVAEQAEKSAVVTHAHDEAVTGAIAVAVAAAQAWNFRQSNIRSNRTEFIDSILPFVPISEVRTKIKRARDLSPEISTLHAAAILGNGIQISCQDTVPFCLFCAGEYLDNYEEALWQTVSALGDRDTTCAIVGGIVALYAGTDSIPQKWLEHREGLPE